MATRTIKAGGGNWGSIGTWVENVVPTASDDVVATAASGNVTIAANAVCRSIDLTGYTGTLTQNAIRTLTVGNATGGSFKFVPTMTYVIGSITTSRIIFISNASVNITTGGITLGQVEFSSGTTGTFTLQDNLVCSGLFRITKGTFTANGKNVTALGANNGAGTCTLNMGTGTWNITGDETIVSSWSFFTTGGLTLNPNTSTVIFAAGVATNRSISTGGTSFYNLQIGSCLDVYLADSCNVINNFTLSSPNQLHLNPGDTLTIGGTISMDNTTLYESSGQWNISKSAGNLLFNGMTISFSNATGGATWTAKDSYDNGNNTGWTIIAPPKGYGSLNLLGVGT